MNARILDPVMTLLLTGKHKFNLSKKWSSSQSPCVQCCRGGGRVRGQQQDVRKRGDAERAEDTDKSAGGHADVQRSDGQARRRPAALAIGAGGWRQLGSDCRLQAQGYWRKGHPLPDSVQRHDQHVLRVSGHSAGPGQALAAIAAARARAAAAAWGDGGDASTSALESRAGSQRGQQQPAKRVCHCWAVADPLFQSYIWKK